MVAGAIYGLFPTSWCIPSEKARDRIDFTNRDGGLRDASARGGGNGHLFSETDHAAGGADGTKRKISEKRWFLARHVDAIDVRHNISRLSVCERERARMYVRACARVNVCMHE